MDNSMLIVLSMVFGICVLTYFVTTLRKKDIVTAEDLMFVQQLFCLTMAIIDELNIKNEKKILQISNIVLCALEYATGIAIGNDNVIEVALEKCYQLCEQMNIELTESRMLIITQLINIGLINRYTDTNGIYLLSE